jgi:mono/diheme cytochrome c family protein
VIRRWFSGAAWILALGCAGSLPQVTVEDAEGTGIPLGDLRAGRERYVAKCSGCHELHPPGAYDDARWAREVEAMAERVRLEDQDRRAILLYLQSMNADTIGNG